MPYYTVAVVASTTCYARFEAKNLNEAKRKVRLHNIQFDILEEQIKECKPADFDFAIDPKSVEIDFTQEDERVFYQGE
jgi:hypothetical protein